METLGVSTIGQVEKGHGRLCPRTVSRLWNKSARAGCEECRPWKPSAFPPVDQVGKGHGRLCPRTVRCWDRERVFFEPVHYLALLERKPGGFDHAKPLEQWNLPDCFPLLRRRMEADDPKSGTRSFIRVLRLLERFSLEEVTAGVDYALDIGLSDCDSIRSVVEHRADGPVRLFSLDTAACSQGRRVRFYRVTELVTLLLEAKEERHLLRLRQQLAKLDLLILDELGYVPASKAGAELLFDVIATAYERNSLIVTTNLPFESWTEVLGSERLTDAALDRLTHRCHILEAKGESYRLQDAKRRRRRTG